MPLPVEQCCTLRPKSRQLLAMLVQLKLQPSHGRLTHQRPSKRRMDYYKYMSEAALPAIAVIEDMDYPDCIGAYCGQINTTIHKGFGLSGALTNGVMRDLGDLLHAD